MSHASKAARSEYNKAYRVKHRDKLLTYHKAYYAANKEQAAARNRKNLYGVTLEQHASLLEMQNSRCGICKTSAPSGKGKWHVDHCHSSGIVRGLLCHHCNVGLGYFKDSPEALKAAAEYLEKHQ